MPYTISRRRSFIRLSWIWLRPSVIIGFIIPSCLYAAFFYYAATVGQPFFLFVYVYPFVALLLLFITIRYMRGCAAKAEARRTDAEWDSFVNAGQSVRPDHAAAANPARWLESSLPALAASSRPAQWLESLQIPFQSPVTVPLQSLAQARDFAARFEATALALLTSQLAEGANTQESDSVTAVGRVMFHGKPHCLVFRQPDAETVIFFLFRVEVAGAAASILCGGTHFIRRAAATGDKARKKRLSDDDVAMLAMTEGFRDRFLKAGLWSYIPIAGVFILLSLCFFIATITFAEGPYNWWRRGELAFWEAVDQWRKSVKWPGLQPDRSAALAELDYLSRVVQNEVLRMMQAAPGSQPAPRDKRVDEPPTNIIDTL